MSAQKLFVLIAISSFAFLSLAPHAGRDPFDGSWKVSVDPQDMQAKRFDDVLTFKGDKVTSEHLTEKGFPPARYEIDTRGQTAAQFTAEAKAEDGATAKWSGMSTGTDLRGTLVWTQKDGNPITYTYTGTRAN